MPVISLPTLPVTDILDTLNSELQQHDAAVLEAPPGAGKTTLVPLSLLQAPWLADHKILLLEPRRIAARNAAARMASLLGEKVGETVGYRIRQETHVSDRTRIEVITEGILTRMLQQDPSLEGVGLVIFDECHERNLNTDLGLALALAGRDLFRDEASPLKLLAMSATLDGQALARLLGDAPILTSEGRMFPVEVHYGEHRKASDDIIQPITQMIQQAHHDTDGSLLVFLPGQREIQRVQQALSSRIDNNTEILPLYSSLPAKAQQHAIAPSQGRKIVLATDIAETSLTIDGVTVVVDSGLARKPHYDPTTAMTRLKTERISQASATQRMGRAGRTAPGRCYRLWSQEQHHQLPQQSTPEILQTDLSSLVLQLLNWGVDDPNELAWLDPPPPALYQQSLDLLQQLGATEIHEGHCRLTPHGEAMSALPLAPRLAHLMFMAHSLPGMQKSGAQIAALLSDRLPSQYRRDELDDYLALFAAPNDIHKTIKPWAKRCADQARRYQQTVQGLPTTSLNSPIDADAALLVALAYPDRIARQKSANGCHFQLANGRQAIVAENSPLRRYPWLAVAELSGSHGSRDDHIRLASALDPAHFEGLLAPLVTATDHIGWQNGRLIAERQSSIGKLIIARTPKSDISDADRLAALHRWLAQKGTDCLNWTAELRQWQQRVLLLRQWQPQDNWPDVSDSGLLANLEQWFDPFVGRISNTQQLAALPLADMLSSLLPWPLPNQLDSLAPTHMAVPSGSRIRIDYLEHPPVLAVKLQEMFGSTSTPAVANGRVALKLHLLSPAGRPLQVTQDLAAFWQNGYDAVKKEMKGRYPKHPWPDDPLQFQATAKTKRHLK